MKRKHIVKHRLSIKCNIITIVISKKRNVNIAECSQIKCMVYYADHEVIKESKSVSESEILTNIHSFKDGSFLL